MAATVDENATLPPGPRPLPLIGNVLDLRRGQLGYLQRLEQIYGKMATIRIGNVPMVLLFRPEHVRYVLTENPRNFTSREVAEELRQLIGDGLLTIDGETHRQQRRLVQPAFHKKRVESYAGIVVQHTEEMLKDWLAGERIDVASAMQQLTMRIVAKCLFNVDLADQVDTLGRAFTGMIGNPISLIEGFLNLHINLPITAYGRRMAAKRTVDRFIYDLIARRRAEGGDAGDVLSMLLEAHDEDGVLSDIQVRDHIMTFFAAGHETTANALTWTFHLLSQYPAEREKLLAELQTVLAGRAPTVDDLPNLPYTEWVLNESMRIYPPAWMLGRCAIQAFDLDGIHFPAGTIIIFSPWVIHRLPDIWTDPEVFRPERWDPASEQKIVPWSYFPFGGGPRICIGMPFAQLEARLLLAAILQQYLPFTAPGFRAEPDPLITLRPKNGLQSILMSTTAKVAEGSASGRLFLQLPDAQQSGRERKGYGGAIGDWFKFLRR
jgi:cytochrome P450